MSSGWYPLVQLLRNTNSDDNIFRGNDEHDDAADSPHVMCRESRHNGPYETDQTIVNTTFVIGLLGNTYPALFIHFWAITQMHGLRLVHCHGYPTEARTDACHPHYFRPKGPGGGGGGSGGGPAGV